MEESASPAIVLPNPEKAGSLPATSRWPIRSGARWIQDRGLIPSLEHVTAAVHGGRVTLLGSVRSDLDARVVADRIKQVPGVVGLENALEINPSRP